MVSLVRDEMITTMQDCQAVVTSWQGVMSDADHYCEDDGMTSIRDSIRETTAPLSRLAAASSLRLPLVPDKCYELVLYRYLGTVPRYELVQNYQIFAARRQL